MRMPILSAISVAILLAISGCNSNNNENQSSIEQLVPNPEGGLESVVAVHGDFVNQSFDPESAENKAALPTSTSLTGKTLRIFHINDLHNHMEDAHRSRGDTHRLAQMVKLMKSIRNQAAANETTLLVSAGDDHTGTVYDELLGFDANSFIMDPAYRAYSAAGMDVATIGNHELDRGAEVLAMGIKQDADFPIISANLHGSKFLDKTHYSPAVIGVSNGLRIGFLGLVTPNETKTHTSIDPDLAVADVLKVTQNLLPGLAEQSDVILIVSHVGYNGQIDGEVRHEIDAGDVEIAKLAASLTDKPVVVIGGHSHTELNADGLDPAHVYDGVPVLQTGANGNALGEIAVSFNTDGSASFQAQLHRIKRRDDRVTESDPDFDLFEHDDDIDNDFDTQIMQPINQQLEVKIGESIGVAGSETYLSTASVLQSRYIGETAIANFMNDTIVKRSSGFPAGPDGSSQNVDIAIFNASGISAGVTPGSTISFNDWFGVMPFADQVVLARMTGAQIREMVQSNAQRVVRPEEISSLNLEGFISRGFLHFSSSLRYTLVLNADATAAQASDIQINSQPIENLLDQTFTVAFNSYIAAGFEGWKGEKIGAGLPDSIIGFNVKGLDLNDTGLVYRNEIVAYIREQGEVSTSTGAVEDQRLIINN